MSVGSQERITRFILNEDHFTVSTNRISHRVFIPPRNLNVISVCRTNNMECSAIWELGQLHVEDIKNGRVIYARADLIAQKVYDIGNYP